MKECLDYVYVPGSDIVEHQQAVGTKDQDPSGARSNHGDRVIADDLACKGLKECGPVREEEYEFEPPVGSFAWRRQQSEEESREEAWV